MSESSDRTLGGLIALVTGGSKGIGSAIAEALAEQGSTVLIASRGEEAGRRKAAELRASGATVEWLGLDVSDDQSWQALGATIRERYGRLDVAVNNAAATIAGSVTEIAPDDWNSVIASCLTSIYLGGRVEIPLMLEAGSGSIINMGSTASVIALAGRAAYVTAKHGVIGLSKSMALDFADQGIRVNTVVVGGVDTEMLRQGAGATPEGMARLANSRPMRRLGLPAEIASVVTFLASGGSSYMTGAVISVDGGLTIQAGIPAVRGHNGSGVALVSPNGGQRPKTRRRIQPVVATPPYGCIATTG